MPRLGELKIVQQPLAPAAVQSLDQMAETGSFLPMLQPGVYEFEVPLNVAECYELVDAHQKPWTDTSTGTQYVRAKFDDAHPLKITQAPPHSANRVGEPYTAQVTNVERDWKIGGVPTKVRDFWYLLKKLGHKAVPVSIQDCVTALDSFAGKRFRSPVGVSWNCSSTRKARFWQATTEKPEGAEVESQQPGCGARYYPDKDIKPGVDGKYPEKIQCSKCGAVVRGFSNLDLTREA